LSNGSIYILFYSQPGIGASYGGRYVYSFEEVLIRVCCSEVDLTGFAIELATFVVDFILLVVEFGLFAVEFVVNTETRSSSCFMVLFK